MAEEHCPAQQRLPHIYRWIPDKPLFLHWQGTDGLHTGHVWNTFKLKSQSKLQSKGGQCPLIWRNSCLCEKYLEGARSSG